MLGLGGDQMMNIFRMISFPMQMQLISTRDYEHPEMFCLVLTETAELLLLNFIHDKE